jgi:uncharacterized membrane protein
VLIEIVMNFACEATMGAVSGLRAFTGPAIISEAARHKWLKLKRTPLAWLATDRAARISTILAVSELVADKLPFMPDRTEGPSLASRFLAGAICGVAIARRRKRTELAIGALVGGSAAIVAAYAGYQYRKSVKLRPVAAALIEDGVAIGLGSAAVAAVCA